MKGRREEKRSRSTVATSKVYHSQTESVGRSWDVQAERAHCDREKSMEVVGAVGEEQRRTQR